MRPRLYKCGLAMCFLRAIGLSKRGVGTKPREFQGSLASGIRIAAQTYQLSWCREWLPTTVNGGGYLVACSKSAWTGSLVWALRAPSEA